MREILPQLPDKWNNRTLKNISLFLRRGKSPVYAEKNEGLLIVNQDCIRWDCIDLDKAKYHIQPANIADEFYLLPEDILINSTGTGTIGRVNQWNSRNIKAVADSHVTVIRINKVEADSKYIRYFLISEAGQRYLEAICYTGSTNQIELSKRYLSKFDIPCAPFVEQRAIAGILSKVDEAIEAVGNSIQAAERLKKSLMQNLLTGKLKSDGTWRNEDELMITKYGVAFKDWKYCQIRDLIKENYILEIQDGNHGELHPTSKDFEKEGIPFVMASDISNGYVDIDKCKRIPNNLAESLRIGFAKNRDVLLSHKASIGYTCIVEGAEPYFMLTPQVTYYRCNPSKLLPEYLLYFIQQYNFQNILEGFAKQSTRNYIGITNQKKMWIYLPESLEEQALLVKPLISADSKLKTQRSKIKSLNILKKSLMQNLITGKIRVDVDKINDLLEEV